MNERSKQMHLSQGEWTLNTQQFLPVDGVNGQDSIAAHITVTVLKAGPDRWHERLKQLRLLQLAQEAQGGATDELIGMLQVLKKREAYED